MVGNNYEFLEALYANGAKGSFDAVGVHTDTACLLRDPGVYYREPSGRIGRFSFSGYREVRATMLAQGDDKPIWMTEFGWSASTEKCDQGVNKGKRPGGVGDKRQAKLLARAYDCLAHDDYMGPAMWFSLQDIGSDPKHIAHRYGLINWSGRHRPAFGAFQDVWRRGPRPTFCGGKPDADKPTVTIDVPSTYYGRLVTTGEAADPTTPDQEDRAVGQRQADHGPARHQPLRLRLVRVEQAALRGAHGRAARLRRGRQRRRRLGRRPPPLPHQRALRHPRPAASSPAWTAATGCTSARASARPPTGPSTSTRTDGSWLRMERRGGRKSKVRKGIGSGKVRYVSTPREKGLWKVFAVLDADAPYKKSKTKVFTFRVR